MVCSPCAIFVILALLFDYTRCTRVYENNDHNYRTRAQITVVTVYYVIIFTNLNLVICVNRLRTYHAYDNNILFNPPPNLASQCDIMHIIVEGKPVTKISEMLS